MKRLFFSVFSVTLVVILLCSFTLSSAPSKNVDIAANETTDNQVITIAQNSDATPSKEKVLESRLLNILNHNYVYNEDFNSVDSIVNESTVALLDMKESEDSSYIEQSIVKDYIFNMYGIEIESFEEINKDLPQKDGYLYIIPRGYSLYEHDMISVTENEDGSYTAKTAVTISTHDGCVLTEQCETLFVVNEESNFGFSIIYSDFSDNSSAM